MGLERHSFHEKRIDDRIAVLHRTRAIGPEGRSLPLTIVDVSVSGMMARCDIAFVPGVQISVKLPAIGEQAARICWSLGGRVGLAFCPALAADDYAALLAALAQAG
ncbi:MAG: pilus assembly protein PilZ [Sphingomonas bacterium]|uniref:PilZ domain-containing protein n=1 Tax=Sphingomonas bacterium TaxID=1895847 RepID=UPI00261A2487|nr:PilZ domain-containing protein [Sphingomonas bacterium]MDB5711398.1 pilus assembly protein PilZ [Sphingomonas bacterium]